MTGEKKFSILAYQEELLEKLKNNTYQEEKYWVYVIDSKEKIWKINSKDIEFIEDVKFKTFLPPFVEEVLAVANIQEKEILLIDLDSFLYQEKSKFRSQEIPQTHKSLLFKNNKIGILTHVLPSYTQTESHEISEISIESILKKLST